MKISNPCPKNTKCRLGHAVPLPPVAPVLCHVGLGSGRSSVYPVLCRPGLNTPDLCYPGLRRVGLML